jgi:hypothetical protein
VNVRKGPVRENEIGKAPSGAALDVRENWVLQTRLSTPGGFVNNIRDHSVVQVKREQLKENYRKMGPPSFF